MEPIGHAKQSLQPKLQPIRHLWRLIGIQAIRQQELYVIGILLGLYLLAALLLRIVGFEASPAPARFVRGLGLELASILSSILVIIMGARQIPADLEARTIYPILAKPVSRAQYLMGRASATCSVGLLAMLMFVTLTLLFTPGLPYQQPLVLTQMLLLKSLGLAMLTALVFCGSLWLPAGVNMLLASGLLFLGGGATNILVQLCGGGGLAEHFFGLIPNFSLFDQFQRFVDGGQALTSAMLGLLLLQGSLWTALLLGIALNRFRRITI